MISEPFDFMIFPNWVIAERSSMKSLQIVHEDFLYKLTTMADSLPTRVDKLVLLALLNQFESGVFTVATTIYSLAKAISPKDCINDLQYRRVVKALNRWLNIRIKLSARSSVETVYQIIDSVSRDKEKLTVGFNPVFVKDYIESGCSDTQSLSVLYELKSPASARLYEILSRQFLDKMIWRISLEELKTLMTINAVYPSQILRVITKAVELDPIVWTAKLES